jgi:tight adherence protein B
LRDRKRMQAKIRALSAEAKASAGVLACLPFAVTFLLYLVAPEYIALLWQKKHGHFMMLCAAGLMSVGVFVMRKMINFKF